jgi:exonuclease VII small subunit
LHLEALACIVKRSVARVENTEAALDASVYCLAVAKGLVASASKNVRERREHVSNMRKAHKNLISAANAEAELYRPGAKVG